MRRPVFRFRIAVGGSGGLAVELCERIEEYFGIRGADVRANNHRALARAGPRAHVHIDAHTEDGRVGLV